MTEQETKPRYPYRMTPSYLQAGMTELAIAERECGELLARLLYLRREYAPDHPDVVECDVEYRAAGLNLLMVKEAAK